MLIFHVISNLINYSSHFLGPLQPSRRRSLFTLASSMVVFLSKAYNLLPLVTHAKAVLRDEIVGSNIVNFFTCFLLRPLILLII